MGAEVFIKGILLRFFLLLYCLISFPSFLLAQTHPASEWGLLYPQIRDRLIPPDEARGRIRELEFSLKRQYPEKKAQISDEKLAFPLRGYTHHSIGGRGGSGYRPQGYDFFDGSHHKGHPGHDLFIHDRNQDGLDDRTGKPVEVIAAAPGIVVSVHSHWRPPSRIRGGNYIWIFDPYGERYYYYAHLDRIFTRVGQIVFRGDPLGTVGRTGRNAYPKRSPTHLHFTVHHSVEGYPRPIDPYQDLVQAFHRE